MDYFYDTEFIEDGQTIDLVSIGIVASDGREYYAVSTDADLSRANPWGEEARVTSSPEPVVATMEKQIDHPARFRRVLWRRRPRSLVGVGGGV